MDATGMPFPAGSSGPAAIAAAKETLDKGACAVDHTCCADQRAVVEQVPIRRPPVVLLLCGAPESGSTAGERSLQIGLYGGRFTHPHTFSRPPSV